MPIVFEKGIVTSTFLVILEDIDLDAVKRDAIKAHNDDAMSEELTDEALSLPNFAQNAPPLAASGALLDDPKFLAELIVNRRITKIIHKTKPHGVRVTTFFLHGKKAEAVIDAAQLTTVREQTETGLKNRAVCDDLL